MTEAEAASAVADEVTPADEVAPTPAVDETSGPGEECSSEQKFRLTFDAVKGDKLAEIKALSAARKVLLQQLVDNSEQQLAALGEDVLKQISSINPEDAKEFVKTLLAQHADQANRGDFQLFNSFSMAAGTSAFEVCMDLKDEYEVLQKTISIMLKWQDENVKMSSALQVGIGLCNVTSATTKSYAAGEDAKAKASRKEMETLKKQAKENIKQIKKDQARVRAQLQAAKDKEAEARSEEAAARALFMSNTVSGLVEGNNDKAARLRTAELKLSDKTTQVTNLRAELEQANADLEQTEEVLATNATALSAAEEQRRAVEEELQEAQRDMGAISSNNAELQRVVAETRSQVTKLQNQSTGTFLFNKARGMFRGRT